METRKFKAIAVSMTLMFTLGSCTKSVFKTTSDKLMKTWSYEKVTFKKNNSLSTKDVTSDFSTITLAFNSDFTLDEVNNTTGSTRVGTWKVDVEQDPYMTASGQSTTATEVLNGTLTDATNGAVYLLKWRSMSVSNSKIKAYEYKDDGTYCYTLVAQ